MMDCQVKWASLENRSVNVTHKMTISSHNEARNVKYIASSELRFLPDVANTGSCAVFAIIAG